MENNDKFSKLLIKPTKLFCRNRINLRCENRSWTIFEHKVLDYILFVMLRSGTTRVTISAFEFFGLLEFKEANGKQYQEFYKALNTLYETKLFWMESSYSEFTRVLPTVRILHKGNKIAGFSVQVNPDLCNVLLWKNNNIYQNLKVTMKLRRKYSYFLFLFLMRDHITDGNCHEYRRMQLRNSLNVFEEESDKHFQVYLRSAIKEINSVAQMNIQLTVRKNLYYFCCDASEIPEENSIVPIECDVHNEEDAEWIKISIQEAKRYELMYQILRDNPELRRLMDEQTSKRRG